MRSYFEVRVLRGQSYTYTIGRMTIVCVDNRLCLCDLLCFDPIPPFSQPTTGFKEMSGGEGSFGSEESVNQESSALEVLKSPPSPFRNHLAAKSFEIVDGRISYRIAQLLERGRARVGTHDRTSFGMRFGSTKTFTYSGSSKVIRSIMFHMSIPMGVNRRPSISKLTSPRHFQSFSKKSQSPSFQRVHTNSDVERHLKFHDIKCRERKK
ncbi:hypothetical protein RIF29_19346 [Crotalaria pallida]|uniref:Uncharacterized protein n=1 Tax=Crotalaria pallida TaxID=3830 RepID=A0AAN9IBB8_CROPI